MSISREPDVQHLDEDEGRYRFAKGDWVEAVADGVRGTVVFIMTSPFEWPARDEPVSATPQYPRYIVALDSGGGGSRVFRSSELEPTEVEIEYPTNVEVTFLDEAKENYNPVEHPRDPETGAFLSRDYDPKADDPREQPGVGTEFVIDGLDTRDEDHDIVFGWRGYPPTWKKSKTPNRVIFLDMFSSMGADFEGCVETMVKSVPYYNSFCEATMDEALGTGAWRTGFGGSDSTRTNASSDGIIRRIAEVVGIVEPSSPTTLNWNPKFHPRSPRTGRFIERLWNIPDSFADIEGDTIAELLDKSSFNRDIRRSAAWRAASQFDLPDDLSEMVDVGPKTKESLRDAGFESVADVVRDPEGARSVSGMGRIVMQKNRFPITQDESRELYPDLFDDEDGGGSVTADISSPSGPLEPDSDAERPGALAWVSTPNAQHPKSLVDDWVLRDTNAPGVAFPYATEETRIKLRSALESEGEGMENLVTDYYGLVDQWKAKPYEPDGQRLERAYMEALDIDGEYRNGSLGDHPPSHGEIEAAGRISELSRALLRDALSESPDQRTDDPMTLQLFRGLGSQTTDSVWANVFASDGDSFSLPGSGLDNWSTNETKAASFAKQRDTFKAATVSHVDEVAAAHDMLFSNDFDSENETLIPSDGRSAVTDELFIETDDGSYSIRDILDYDGEQRTEGIDKAAKMLVSSVVNSPDVWSTEALDAVESWAETSPVVRNNRDELLSAINDARQSSVDGSVFDTPTTPQQTQWQYEEWEDHFNLANASSGRTLADAGASPGVASDSMEVVTADNGETAYIKYYEDPSDVSLTSVRSSENDSAHDRAMVAYEATKLLGGSAPPHHSENDGSGNPLYTAVTGVDGRRAAEVLSSEKDGLAVQKDRFLDEAAIQLIAGNIDAHADNVMYDDDGGVYMTDLDHAGGVLYEDEPGGDYSSNAERAISHLQFSGVSLGVTDFASEEEFRQELIDRAIKLAQKAESNDEFLSMLESRMTNWSPEFAANVLENIQWLAGSETGVQLEAI